MRLIAAFAITCLFGCAYSGVTAVRVFGATDTAHAVRCDLTPASNAAQARVKATCVRATAEAKKIVADIGGSYSVRVPANACQMVDGNDFVWDCSFSLALSRESCHGTVRVRGRSSDPAKLSRHLRGIACIA